MSAEKIEALLGSVGKWAQEEEAVETPYCLDDNDMASFVSETLSGYEQERARIHVANCRYCFLTVVELQNMDCRMKLREDEDFLRRSLQVPSQS